MHSIIKIYFVYLLPIEASLYKHARINSNIQEYIINDRFVEDS